MHLLLAAIGIAIFLEGVVPFLSPRRFRQMIVTMLQVSDHGIRALGLVAILAGVGIVYLVHYSGKI